MIWKKRYTLLPFCVCICNGLYLKKRLDNDSILRRKLRASFTILLLTSLYFCILYFMFRCDLLNSELIKIRCRQMMLQTHPC
jgi:hypothetical protein